MDCNKEDAIKAHEIAEKNMEKKDFVTARKFALKAQRLYPELDNISQMIMVCDVHCSAENKAYGNEKDWYGILKIEPTADEASIKKQYRKFALVLHPDKNRFSGAADAFKLIGEAQRVLLDREKRMLHDIKCKSVGRSKAPNRAPQQASTQSNVRNPPWVQNNFNSNRPTFWTVCPFCSVKYQFYKEVLNKLLLCQSCKKSFTGYEMNGQGVTPGPNLSRPVFHQQKEVQNQGPSKVSPQSTFMNTSKVGPQGNIDSENSKKKSTNVKSGKRKKVEESSESSTSGSSTDSEDVEDSDSEDDADSSESSADSDDDIVIDKGGEHRAGENVGGFAERYPRRSSRAKRNVSYNENLSDDEDVMAPSKKAKPTEQEAQDPSPKEEGSNMSKPDAVSIDTEDDEIEGKQKESSFVEESLQNGGKKKEMAFETGTVTEDEEVSEEGDFASSSKSTQPETYEYPDPDFSDFDKDRKAQCFSAGQIWAVYDTRDAMPRFYARIRKVFSPGFKNALSNWFKLRITWLDLIPSDDDEIDWVSEDLPVSCGTFAHGRTENTEDHPMFSHLVYCEKGSLRDTFNIYPRKGETWAVFKNWDVKWSSDPNNNRKYDYEFVEVLSDYDDGVGLCVAYLSKVKGFVCLFSRTMEGGVELVRIIPPKEIFRFSHRVPSFKMTGEEREDVPKASFELDPASLPANI